MDYLKRLENSVQNFESEVSRLAKIDKLIQDTNDLIEAVDKEQEIFEKSGAQLEKLQLQISKNCKMLAEFTENEGAARQKFLADIHKNILDDSQAVIEKLSAPLENSRVQLFEICKQINEHCETLEEYAENEGAARQKFLADIHKNILDDSQAVIEKLSAPLENSRVQLFEICKQINEHCETLEEYAENEGAARQKFLADIHKNILDDSQAVIEKLSAPLENSRVQLAETCEQINKIFEVQQKSQEIFLSNIENILAKYNKKNLELYANINDALSEIGNTNLNTDLDDLPKNISALNEQLKANALNLDNKIDRNNKAINLKITSVAEEVKNFSEIFSVVKDVKVLVSITVIINVILCAVIFIKI